MNNLPKQWLTVGLLMVSILFLVGTLIFSIHYTTINQPAASTLEDCLSPSPSVTSFSPSSSPTIIFSPTALSSSTPTATPSSSSSVNPSPTATVTPSPLATFSSLPTPTLTPSTIPSPVTSHASYHWFLPIQTVKAAECQSSSSPTAVVSISPSAKIVSPSPSVSPTAQKVAKIKAIVSTWQWNQNGPPELIEYDFGNQANQKPVIGAEVTFECNNRSFTKSTDSTGVAKLEQSEAKEAGCSLNDIKARFSAYLANKADTTYNFFSPLIADNMSRIAVTAVPSNAQPTTTVQWYRPVVAGLVSQRAGSTQKPASHITICLIFKETVGSKPNCTIIGTSSRAITNTRGLYLFYVSWGDYIKNGRHALLAALHSDGTRYESAFANEGVITLSGQADRHDCALNCQPIGDLIFQVASHYHDTHALSSNFYPDGREACASFVSWVLIKSQAFADRCEFEASADRLDHEIRSMAGSKVEIIASDQNVGSLINQGVLRLGDIIIYQERGRGVHASIYSGNGKVIYGGSGASPAIVEFAAVGIRGSIVDVYRFKDCAKLIRVDLPEYPVGKRRFVWNTFLQFFARLLPS